MPKPPPRSSSGSSTPCVVADRGVQATAAGRDTSKPTVSKICEPMCECRPSRSQRRPRQHSRDRLERGAAGEREAELLVLVRGGDELVGVRLDADGDPHHHPRAPDSGVRRERASRRDLVERVDDDPADAGVDGPVELGDATCCCRAADPLGRQAGGQRDGELAAGAHVEPQALLGDPASDRLAQERLAGVVDVGAGARRTPPRSSRQRVPREVVLVEDVRRGAELARRSGSRRAPPTVSAPSAARRTVRGQSRRTSALTSSGRRSHAGPVTDVAVQRTGLVRAHWLPTSARARRRRAGRGRWRARSRVASMSHSRARCRSVTSSSPRGRTRQAS